MTAIHDPYNAPDWVSGFVAGGGPRYLQIVKFLETAIATGSLRPGDRLPAQRQLADALGIDLTTVTRGFTEARRRQLIEARGTLGTFIAAPKVELTQSVDLSMNIPPPPDGVEMETLLRQGMSQVLMRTNIDLLMTYHLGGGSRADRDAGAQWLTPMLGRVDRERVVATPGAQAALAALILATTQPGDVILMEPLGYPGLPMAAEQLGRRIETVAVDADGMRPDALDDACRRFDARLIYLNPTLQNPTTSTMPAQRRAAIVETAARCNVKIVEDDPYWLFPADAPPPLARLMPSQVYYLSTLSKCLSPGLRTAFLVAPDGERADAFLAALRTFSLTSPLTTALVTQWINDGSAAQLLAGVQAESRVRQRMATGTLSGATRAAASEGIHVWHTLPSYWRAQDLSAAARAEGLVVTPSTAFHTGANPPNAIRISLGGCPSRGQLDAALRKLSNLLAQKPALAREMVI
ncbi:PLP-dependent aminotransferase family protein [Paraburkholderia sp.]|uniref:aminotransferase-like domain-containing protein n=1 Tax=Paraburkholderia sp. TaxID=1926495 RepID=UPI002388BF1F|nr:PLP-dependent aminotransferase family protein [Paraburkholderia sp.]MDE1179897.1 PLP-dependent aminotransferase family protein [Paraburkholderia sp.]